MKRERWVEKQDFLGLLWVLSLVVGSAAGGQIFFFFSPAKLWGNQKR